VAGSVPALSSHRMTIAGSFFGVGQGQLAHPEIIDDEQRHRFQELHALLRLCIRGRLSEFIKRRVRCANSARITRERSTFPTRIVQIDDIALTTACRCGTSIRLQTGWEKVSFKRRALRDLLALHSGSHNP